MTTHKVLPDSPRRRIALMSIKPQFWERIAEGSKHYELRRSAVRLEEGDLVMVYATSPEKALVGCFEVDGVVRAPATEVWRRLGSVLGVSRATYWDYFAGAELATAIGIRAPRSFDSIPLADLRKMLPDFTPPQSFLYWGYDAVRKLRLSTLPPPPIT